MNGVPGFVLLGSNQHQPLELYGTGLKTNGVDWDRMVERTAGASGAFIRELLRKAAVFAAEDSNGEFLVREQHLDEALAELVVAGGALTHSLLGANVRGAQA